jgi:hypothetical protein
MKRSARWAVVGAWLLWAASGCKHNEGDSVIVTGDGARLSSEAIDRDPLALLPSEPLAITWVDAQAFFASAMGGEANRLATKYIPLGQDAGFVAQRDLRTIVGGVYSLAGADFVAVAQGDFHPDLIKAAVERASAAPSAVPLVRSSYAGNDVYTAATIGFTVVTAHTILLGNQTGMRRALDRIRDNRLKRDVPDWMIKLVEQPQASLVLAGDASGRPEMNALAQTAPFLVGLSAFRILGNFQPPGLNFAGTLSYPDAQKANAGADALRNAGQLAGALNLLAIFGLSSPLRKLEVSTQGTDTMFVSAVDGKGLADLLSRAM